MNVRIGDTVRFLNDIGGGKVVGFNGPSEVIVEMEDGFGFPYPISECVVVGSSSTTKPTEAKATANVVVPKKSADVIAQSHTSQRVVGPSELNIFLAFAPTDMQKLDFSDMDVSLVNNSDYTLFFSLLSKQDNKYKCLKSTMVSPYENLAIDKVKRGNLSILEHLKVQLIAFKGIGAFKSHSPIDRDITTRLVKFCKQSSFSFSPFLGCEAMSIDLTKQANIIEESEIDLMQQSLNKLSDKMNSGTPSKGPSASNSSMLEIDLHIDSLLDSTAGMSSGDMLEYQMDHFRKVMEENKKFNGRKIIFIHGKGDGVLRSSLERELKKMGRANKYQQASFKKYGYGAIMVII